MSGFDFAAVDENGHVDFKGAFAHGADFVYLNASPGNSVWSQAGAARDAGLVVGPYLFPPIHATVDPVVWAGDVTATVEELPGDLPLAFDFELPRGIAGTGMDRAGIAKWVLSAVARLKAKNGYAPLLYSSNRVLESTDTDTVAGLLDGLAGVDGCPLWLAYYSDHSPPVPSAWGPGNWWMHQDRGDAKGAFTIHQVDTDVFNYCGHNEVGERVRWVQRRLGFGITRCDGVFGPETHRAVVSFQGAHGLVQDGVIGPRTFAWLAVLP